MNMFYYLHFQPNLVSSFLKEGWDTYQKDKNFQKDFHESRIAEVLKQNGIKSVDQGFKTLSKAAHASRWGSQLYGTRMKSKDNKDRFLVKHEPMLDPEKATGLFNIASSTHYDFLRMIIWHRMLTKLDLDSPPWIKIKKFVDEKAEEVIDLNRHTNEVLLPLFKI
ncbi:MAG: hypothetical protein AAB668_04400 [Patescibacteria group bacterium]